jgi:hypothetical protein
MMRALVACAAVAASALFGCSSGSTASSSGPPVNQPPIIDSVNAAAMVKANADGTYPLWTLVVTFHDPDDTIAQVHLVIPDLKQDIKQPLSASASANEVDIGIPFPKGTNAGAHPYELSLIDQSGAESAVYKNTVTLVQ